MKTASTEREAIGHVTGDALRPVLARLRRSSRYAVFGLAAITIAGCAPEPKVCHKGKLYTDRNGDGIFTKPDEWGDVDCVEPTQARRGEQ